MMNLKYKLLSETAKAPSIAFDGTNNTMGIDVFTDREVRLRAGSKHTLTHDCSNKVYTGLYWACSCHPHGSLLPYANITTGVAFELPEGTHLSWGGRSGLAFKQGMLPFEGKIDSNYRGELAVKIWSMDPEHDGYVIPAGTKIAQLYIIEYHKQYTLDEVSVLNTTGRGTGGFGSTGG